MSDYAVKLQPEIWVQIVSMLPVKDVVSVMRTNKFLYNLCQDNALWYRLYKTSRPVLSQDYTISSTENWYHRYKTEELYKLGFTRLQLLNVKIDVEPEKILKVEDIISDINDDNRGVVAIKVVTKADPSSGFKKLFRSCIYEYPSFQLLHMMEFPPEAMDVTVKLVTVNAERKFLAVMIHSRYLVIYNYETKEQHSLVKLRKGLAHCLVDFYPPNPPKDGDSFAVIENRHDDAHCTLTTFLYPSVQTHSEIKYEDDKFYVGSMYYNGKLDNTLFLSGHYDGCLRLFNSLTGEIIHKIPISQDSYVYGILPRRMIDPNVRGMVHDNGGVKQYILEIGPEPLPDVNFSIAQSQISSDKTQVGKKLKEIVRSRGTTFYDTFGHLIFQADGQNILITDMESGEEVNSFGFWKKIKGMSMVGIHGQELVLIAGTIVWRVKSNFSVVNK